MMILLYSLYFCSKSLHMAWHFTGVFLLIFIKVQSLVIWTFTLLKKITNHVIKQIKFILTCIKWCHLNELSPSLFWRWFGSEMRVHNQCNQNTGLNSPKNTEAWITGLTYKGLTVICVDRVKYKSFYCNMETKMVESGNESVQMELPVSAA